MAQTAQPTLAHVIARQAGHSPAEINASDERDGKAKKWGGGGRGGVEADGLEGADNLDHEGETEMPRDTNLKFKGIRTNLKKGGKENSKKAAKALNAAFKALNAAFKGQQMLQRPIICDLYLQRLVRASSACPPQRGSRECDREVKVSQKVGGTSMEVLLKIPRCDGSGRPSGR